MDLQKLYDRVQGQIDQGSFCLSEETTGMAAIQQLCMVFGMDGLVLSEAGCELREETLVLQGFCVLPPSDGKLAFSLTVAADGQVRAGVNLAGLYVDEEQWFCVRDGQLEIALQEGTDCFSETMSGHISLGNILFSFQGDRKEPAESRKVILSCEGQAEASAILDSGLALFGLSLSAFPLRSVLIDIISFSFSYQLPSGWLMEGSSDRQQYADSFEWQIQTSLEFELAGLFGMKKIGFGMEKYGSAYWLSLSGLFELFDHEFPFSLTYDGMGFHIVLTECGGAVLKTLDELGGLSGDQGISQHLPKDFVPEGRVSLHSLQLALPRSFSSVSYFQVGVDFDFEWEISHSPLLVLHDIMFSYEYNPMSKFFCLTGRINFLGAETLLHAGVVVPAGGGAPDWQFLWRMYDDEAVSITDFVVKVAEFLGTPRTQISLPQVQLCRIQAAYAGGSFSFQARIDVTESRLFSSETDLMFVSKPVGEKRDYAAKLSWRSTTHSLTIGNILEECGAGAVLAELPAFLQDIGLEEVDIDYDFIENRISTEIVVSGVGRLSVCLAFGEEKEYRIIFTPEINEISLTGIPVAGSLVEKVLPSAGDFSVSDFVLYFFSKEDKQLEIPAGVSMTVRALGKTEQFVLYQPAPPKVRQLENGTGKRRMRQDAGEKGRKTAWITVNKTFSVLSIYRLGLGLDDSRLALTVDAALNILPLSFAAQGMGIGIHMSSPSEVSFYLSGLAVSFRNDFLSIAGEFVQDGDQYQGKLAVQVKQISVVAVGGYSSDGAFMVFAAVKYNFGGPPAFFVTGFSFGFGIHQDLLLPEITEVLEHPLVQAARGEISRKGLSGSMPRYIKEAPGEKFIAAGVRFTSFNILDSSIIAIVKFGNIFELGILGLAEIRVPPNCPQTPVAYAGLALEAVVRPEAGYFGAEARLTSESYLFSKDCKLTGGFALYGWFGGEHSGDMVLTIGGYYPGYQKPEHYPTVPRVGFEWKIGDNLDISGEMYFALTPREIMAGGRLNVVYTLGKLRAWFIAAADFIMGWKPFYYEASVRVQIGVSYRVDFLFVHHTFTVELGVGLSLWGPEFGGIAHISWFIISFDIHFGSRARNKNAVVSWKEFTDSFLPQESMERVNGGVKSDQGKQSVPVTVNLVDGVIKMDERTVCRGDGLAISAESSIPVTSYSVNGADAQETGFQCVVRPVGEKTLKSCFQVGVLDESGGYIEMETSFVRKNLPSALWGGQGGETLVKDAVCGIQLRPYDTEVTLFPEKQAISLDELYEYGTIRISDAFAYQGCPIDPAYVTEGTVEIFHQTADARDVRERREQFLAEQGICGVSVSLQGYAANAVNLLSEDFMVCGGK